MASVNKVLLIGHLGKEPESRFTTSGDPICNFSIATSEKYKAKDGNIVESTEWHRVTLFGKQAEVACQYLKKGSPVYIEGRIRTRKWQDKEGNDRYSTEIVGDRMQLLGGKTDAEQEQPKAAKPAQPAQRSSGFDDMADEIPF